MPPRRRMRRHSASRSQPPRERDVFDEVFAEYVVEALVGKGQRTGRVERHDAGYPGAQVGVEPAFERMVAATEVQFARYLRRQVVASRLRRWEAGRRSPGTGCQFVDQAAGHGPAGHQPGLRAVGQRYLEAGVRHSLRGILEHRTPDFRIDPAANLLPERGCMELAHQVVLDLQVKRIDPLVDPTVSDLVVARALLVAMRQRGNQPARERRRVAADAF